MRLPSCNFALPYGYLLTVYIIAKLEMVPLSPQNVEHSAMFLFAEIGN